MNLSQLLETLKADDSFLRNVNRWEVIPPAPGRYADFPENLDARLRDVFAARGIDRLYSHQAEAVVLAAAGRSFVVPTPTASGKTLCYNLPVLDRILNDPQARALYLFPTKALSQDQMHEVHGLVTDLGVDIKTYTFDGDTPGDARRVAVAGKNAFEFGTMLSFAIPGTVIGVSYILAFNVPPIELTGTGIILVVSFIFRNMPVGVRAGIASMSQLDKSLDESSLTLGANSWQTFRRVILPLLRPAIVIVIIMRAMIALSAFAAIFAATVRSMSIRVTLWPRASSALATPSPDIRLTGRSFAQPPISTAT